MRSLVMIGILEDQRRSGGHRERSPLPRGAW